MKKIITLILTLTLALGLLCIPANAAESVPARFTDIVLEADEVPTGVAIYNINDFNYIKLRDFAALITGTKKHILVYWDADAGIIVVETGKDYTPIEGDLAPGDGENKTASPNAYTVLIDGEEMVFDTYIINDFTYFKLRDLCVAFDIYLTWDGETRTSGIFTDRNFSGSENQPNEEPTEGEDGITAEDFANASPRTNEDFYELMCYMKEENITSFSDTVENVSYTSAEFEAYCQQLEDSFRYGYGESAEDYLYHMTFFEGITWKYTWWHDGSGNIYKYTYTLSFTLRDGMSQEETLRQIDVFTAECQAIIAQLYANGSLTENMTEREKAKVLYEYMDHRFRYDYDYYDVTAYKAIMNNRAVCEGYTAIYNYLCNLVGVPAKAVFGASGSEGHSWTVVESEGQTYYIDVTWGDPMPDRGSYYSDLSYFWISYDELMRLDPQRVICDSMPWE